MNILPNAILHQPVTQIFAGNRILLVTIIIITRIEVLSFCTLSTVVAMITWTILPEIKQLFPRNEHTIVFFLPTMIATFGVGHWAFHN